MNEIKIFNNPKFGEVRTIITESNDPIFCLSDICKILDLNNVAMTKSRLNQDGVSTADTIDSMGRTQKASFINESNLYKTIFQSRKPEAEEFTEWVTSEILPSIRKHGVYATELTINKMITDPDFAIQLLTNLKEERESKKIIEAEKELYKSISEYQTNQIDEMKPKVLFADSVSASDRSCLIAELAKILNQNGIETGQNRLFIWLRDNGYLCKSGEYYNQPTQRAMELGLFEIKKTAINKPDGTILMSITTKVTGKGQIYFVNKFLGKSKTEDAA